MLTDWATDFFYLVLDDTDADRGDIMDLTTLFDGSFFLMDVELAPLTMGGTMRKNFIGKLDLQERSSLVTFLST